MIPEDTPCSASLSLSSLAMSTAAGSTAAEADKTAPVPEDRFLWLEDVTGEKSLDWARARNAESTKVLVTPEEVALEKRILDILDSKERIPDVNKLGPYYYNFWRDAKNPRGSGAARRSTSTGSPSRPGRP
jgi:prolyl oligopeptidase